MTVIQPVASQSSSGAPGAPGAPASRRAGAYTDVAASESPERESAPKTRKRREEPESAVAAGQAATPSDAPAARKGEGPNAAAGGEGGRKAQPTDPATKAEAAARPLAPSAVTGRTAPADAGIVAATARPAPTTLAAALQVQAEGIVNGVTADGSPEAGADAGGALAEGAKRLAAKGGGEAPAVAAPGGGVAPGDKDKKAGKAATDPAAEIKGAAKAVPTVPAPDVAEAAADVVQAGADAQPQTQSDRGGAMPPTTTAPAPSGVQPHAAQATPGLHVGAQLSAGLAAQVAGEIAAHAGSRSTRFEVRLDPAELGRVDVRLDIGHDGRVQTRLIVERPETLDMLRNDSRELARTLEQAGFQLGQGGLAFQLKEGRAGLWEAAERRGGAGGEPEAVEDVAPAAYRRASAAGAGGVDMTV